MAKPMATINGKPVYSNKKMNSIVNSRISFSDGSWCDVTTGEVENKGSGYINIGTPPSGKGGKKKIETKTFTGIALDVKNLMGADLEIYPYDGIGVEVAKEGRKSEIDNIEVCESGNMVVVKGKNGQSGGSNIRVGNISISGIRTGIRQMSNFISSSSKISVSGTSNSNIVVSGSGSNISINSGGNSENETKVKIKVPKGFPVSITDIDGLSTVGDTEGPFRVSSSGGEVRVGSVGDTTINIHGSTKVNIKKVSKKLSVSIHGSGKVKVRDGVIKSLTVDIHGSGKVYYGGRATDANLKSVGSGDIDINYVENRPVIQKRGSCDVEVNNW